MSKQLVITGGLGFIGKHFYDFVKDDYENILIIDKLNYAADLAFFEKICKPKHQLYIADITNFPAMLRIIPPDSTIVHLAAESHVDHSFQHSFEFTHANTLGTHTMLEVARAKKINAFIKMSTDEVYGQRVTEKALETDRLQPTNPYSASKAAADIMCQTYATAFGVPTMIIRANNIFGPYQHYEKIIPATVLAANGGPKLSIHGKGQTRRHFLHVKDISRALCLLMQQDIPDVHVPQIYNVSGDTEIKMIDLIEMIGQFSNQSIEDFAQFVPDRPFNDKRYLISDDKLRALGWSVKENFEENLLNIYKHHEVLVP